MIAIVGLGNPGEEYQGTRHNIGFRVLDQLARRKELTGIAQDRLSFLLDRDLKAELAESHFKKSKILLIKPTTFVNNSGETVKKVMEKFNLKKRQIWVVNDDLNLPVGMVRARSNGRSGGHKGLEDIITNLGSQDFPRLRVGIKPVKGFEKESMEYQEGIEAKKFVLAPFTKREEKIVDRAVEKAIKYLIRSLGKGKFSATTID